MAITGVYGSSVRIGNLTGILKNSPLAIAVPGTDYAQGSCIETEFSFLQTALNLASPLKIKWVLAEHIVASTLVGGTTAGCNGGITLATTAAANKSATIWSHPGATLASIGMAIPAATGGTWGQSIRFSIAAGVDATTTMVFGCKGVAGDLAAVAVIGSVSTTHAYYMGGANAVDLGIIGTTVHTVAAYRTGGLTFVYLDGVLINVGGTANIFPTEICGLIGSVTNGATGAIQSMNCYWDLALVPSI